ncbi:hypothetical protein Csa_023607, partial [Cucumis sativus]
KILGSQVFPFGGGNGGPHNWSSCCRRDNLQHHGAESMHWCNDIDGHRPPLVAVS